MEIFENLFVGLRAVLACAESHSAQCYPAQSLTSRSVSQREVTFFAIISVIKNLSAKTILACLSEAQVGWIHGEKKCQKIIV